MREVSQSLPEGWHIKALGDICNIDPEMLSGAIDPNYTFRYIDIASVGPSKISDDLALETFRSAPSRARKRVQKDDVLMATVRPNLKSFAKVCFDGELVASTGFAVLRAIKDKSHPEFLKQILFSADIESQVESLVAGSNYPAITVGNVRRLHVAVPPYFEQCGIAEVLSALDEQIEQTEALVAKLELTRSGLYASLRDTYPPTIHIGEHFNLTSGMTPLRSTTHFYGAEGVPWVKTLDLNEGRLFETDEKVTARALAACSLRILPVGTVLLAMYGGWIQIGRTALLETDACTNQAITALCPKCSADWNPYFVMKSLQAWRHKWRDYAVSTRKDPNITKSDIGQFMLPMPGIVEQTRWAENLETADELVNTHKSEATKLRLQKQGLMRDLLTGKVRVNGSANA